MSSDYFHRNRSKQTGFHNECRDCRRRVKEEKQEAVSETLDLIRQLEAVDIKMLHRLATQPDPIEATTLPHVSTVLEHVMEMFGGSEGYAKCVMSEFLAARPGSVQRQKLLDMVLRLTNKVTDSGAARVPLKHLTDEDLEREIQRRLRPIDVESSSREVDDE